MIVEVMGLDVELVLDLDLELALEVDLDFVEVDDVGVALPFPFEFVVVELQAEEGALFIANPVRLNPPNELLVETWRVRRRVAGGEGREVVRLRLWVLVFVAVDFDDPAAEELADDGPARGIPMP